MDKKVAGLLGAAAAVATVGVANGTDVQGTPQNPATNYRELLNPVPNAVAALKADDARRANASQPDVKLAQYYHHHHHHHHHGHYYGPRVRIIPPRHYHHHHHHHHHHHGYYDGR
jgi:hypothetical protein